jgi:asparagine synthase (glutamine-hydrolysing)
LSGFLGIFRRDRAPVEPRELQRIVDQGILQGAEDGKIWVQNNIGLAHAIPDAADSQPAFLRERRLTITGDVRLVAREALRAGLAASNRHVPTDAGDALFVLHAYALWGAECTAHLSGDFSFAIWDGQKQTLFCARDHFGIKPFYYVLFSELFIFSDSLDALRMHARVSDALNESAVGDFLLFGLNCDNSTTTFRDIQRLPPAHSLLVSCEAERITRYWSVPTGGRMRYAQPSDYVERFREVFNLAVAERLDGHGTGVLLSGGLDSASVAAIAREAAARSPVVPLRAFTISNDVNPQDGNRLDGEAQFAAEMAKSLAIPWELVCPDGHGDLEAAQMAVRTPEPVDDPLFACQLSTFRKMSAHCRVLLSGEGADNLMHFEMWPYARDLRARGEWGSMFGELLRYAWQRPFPWRGIGARLQRWTGAGPEAPQPFPKWIAPEFAKRLDLHARWRSGQALPIPPQAHPIHATAVASMYLPQWTRLFELENPSITKCHVEVRYPFLDLRVIEYLLAIPPFPWFLQKRLLREAMAGRLLDSVRLRPKTPFAGDPLLLHLQRFGPFGVKSFGYCEAAKEVGNGVSSDVSGDAAQRNAQNKAQNRIPKDRRGGEMDLYINRSSLSPLHGKMTAEQVNQKARPICFNFWLQSLRNVGYN